MSQNKNKNTNTTSNTNKNKTTNTETQDFEIVSFDNFDSEGNSRVIYEKDKNKRKNSADESSETPSDDHSSSDKDYKKKNKKGFREAYVHIFFLAAVILLIGVSATLLIIWSKGKQLVINPEDAAAFKYESLDHYAYFDPTTNPDYVDDGVINIVYMCDRYTCNPEVTDDIPNLIAEKTGGNVSVLYLEEQTAACISDTYGEVYSDSFSLYRICRQLTDEETPNFSLMEYAIENCPDKSEEYTAYKEEISSIDFNKTDVLVIALGSSDCFCNIPLQTAVDDTFLYGYVDGFCGGLEQSILLLSQKYPNMQIIVSSPSFFYTDVDGVSTPAYNLSNDSFGYGQYICNMEIAAEYRHATFVDNFFGTEFSEEYFSCNLEDDLFHPNKNGRQIIADHIVEYMYFNK